MGRRRSSRRPFPSPANGKANGEKHQFLTVGSTVEMRTDDDGFNGVWYAGKIVETIKRKGRFLIQFEHLLSDEDPNKPLEELVDIRFLRPSPPPPPADRRFEINDVVDAFHCDGWWRGVVGKVDISSENSAVKYTVFFEQSAEKIRFRANDLRFHLVWEDGKWSGPTKEEIPIIDNCEEKSADDDDDVTKHSGSIEEVTSPSTAKGRKVQKRSSKRKRNEVSEILAIEKSADDAIKDFSSNEAVTSSKHRKVKRRNNPPDIEEGENRNVSEDTATEKASEDSPSKETEINFSTENADSLADQMGESSNSAVDDQIPPTNIESERHVENLNQTPPLVFPNREQVEDRVLPFAKTLQVWELVDSLDVLQVMPQKPHFSPLFELSEPLREGYAVGQYLNFAKLVETTTKMRVNEPRNVFESNLKALADLELHGFDVEPVVDRLKKLLSFKTRLEELESESKEAKIKIAQCNAEKEKREEEIREIDEKISMLEAKRATKEAEKMGKESERDSLGVVANGIDEQIAKADLDFENLASAPW